MLPKASYEVLDHILLILQTATEQTPINLFDARLSDTVLKEISNRDWEIIRRKLLTDKMIDFIPLPIDSTNPHSNKYDAYFITFDGLMLLDNEKGYSGRNRKQKLSAIRQFLETLAIGIATVCLALFAGLDYFHNIHHHGCPVNCVIRKQDTLQTK